MSQHIRRLVAITASALLALILGTGGALSASAVTSSGHGVGYLWSGDDVSWIGSYRLADGTLAFCLQAGKASPVGSDFSYVDGTTLGWFSADDSARLAYISREWAGSTDPTTAAAGQLATWTVSGLNGHTQGWYASRAGANSKQVLDLTATMLAKADAEATRSVHAAISLSLPEAGKSSVRADLNVDRITGGATPVAAGTHSAKVTLSGAVFSDGSASKTVANGVDEPITPSGSDPTVTVGVTASFAKLPYGNAFTVAYNPAPVQNLLVARPADAEASAHTQLTTPSPLPFQPVVTTKTSAAQAAPGAHVTDLLTVGVLDTPNSGLLPTWAVYENDGQLTPIPLVVQSSLLGPFSDPIVRSSSAPANAPVVCTVEVAVSAPGDYRTPDCVLPSVGSYVWVERIAPESTAPQQGGARVKPWNSEFGVASEITIATAPVVPPPPAQLAKTGSTTSWVPFTVAGLALPIGTALIAIARHRQRGYRRHSRLG